MARKIVLIIFGSIALLGLIITITGFAMGGLPLSVTVSNGQLIYHNSRTSLPVTDAPGWLADGGWESIPEGEREVRSPGGKVEKLKLDISAGRVVIQTGEKAELSVRGSMPFSESFEDGTWTITTPHSRTFSLFNFSWWGDSILPDGKNSTIFTITLPKGLQKAELQLAAGEMDISGLELEALDCNTDMGSVKLRQVSAQSARLEVGMGSIEATDLEVGEASLTASMGNIKMTGSVTEKLSADCSMGSISATLARPASYGWEAEVGMGTIRVDGQRIAGVNGESKGGDADARPYFDLECGMGTVTISFD